MTESQRRLAKRACLLLLVFLGACVSIQWGRPIPNEALQKLKIGESTHADILLALGQPRGEGVALASQEPVPRKLLFYEYITGDNKTANLEIMLVFVAKGKYDGHVWFAGTERIRKKGGLGTAEEVEMGAFPDPAPLEAKFKRGQTTRDEVINALGEPSGAGGVLFPPKHRKGEVLYYEKVRIDDPQKSGDEITYHIHQQMMGVMFADGRFDGFMWFTTPKRMKGTVQ